MSWPNDKFPGCDRRPDPDRYHRPRSRTPYESAVTSMAVAIGMIHLREPKDFFAVHPLKDQPMKRVCDHCGGTCSVEVPLEDRNEMACPICRGDGVVPVIDLDDPSHPESLANAGHEVEVEPEEEPEPAGDTSYEHDRRQAEAEDAADARRELLREDAERWDGLS